MLPNTTCYPTCQPTHHHSVDHITQLNILPSNWPLNTKYCPSFRWSQHSAKQIAQRSIPPIMSLNTTCCPTNYPNQYAVQHADRLAAQHNMIPIICPDTTCCPTNGAPQYAAQHADRLAAQHNLESYVDCCFCLYFAPVRILSLITHDYRLSLIFFALCFVLF